MIIVALIVVSCLVGWFAYSVKNRHGGMWGSGVFGVGCAWAYFMGLASQAPDQPQFGAGLQEIALGSLPPALVMLVIVAVLPKGVDAPESETGL